MSVQLTLNQAQLSLPNIDFIESSEQAFGNAFLETANILQQQLEQIKADAGVSKDFTRKPFNLAILGLFSKMCRHYYSYVLLEIHHDRIGSQLLIEQLCDAAITLTYLLEEGSQSLFSEYISASVHQARSLLIEVTEQLQQSPRHRDLLILKAQLETFISKHQQHAAEHRPSNDTAAYLWGPQAADTTAKRATAIGLNFLINPARHIALRVMPASWQEPQLLDWHSLTYSSRTLAPSRISFTDLRDASYLCLHATQTFLEEVINYQDVQTAEIELHQQLLNVLYEWFYNAHNVCQQRCFE